MNYELRPYQIEGQQFMDQTDTGNTYICDDTGLGKTLMVLDYCVRNNLLPVLIFAPSTGILTWQNHIEDFFNEAVVVYEGTQKQKEQAWIDFHEQGANFLISKYHPSNAQALHERTSVFVKEWRWEPRKFWGAMVLDEVHLGHTGMMNHKSQFFKAAEKMCKQYVRRRFPITGSPMKKSPADLYAPLRFCNGERYSSYWRFVNTFCLFEDNGFGKVLLERPANLPAFRDEIRRYMLRRYKKDHLKDLPDKSRQTMSLQMDPEQKRMYKDMVNDLMTISDNGEFTIAQNKAVAFIKLRKILVCPESVGASTKGASMELALELIESYFANNQPFVVFTPFREAASLLEDHVRSAYSDAQISVLMGGLNAQEIRRRQSVFQKGAASKRLLIGVIKAAVSYDAFIAQDCYFMGYEMSAEENKQAEDRLWRSGQQNAVLCRYGVYDNTIDEHIKDTMNSRNTASEWVMSTEATYQAWLAAIDNA